MRSWAGRGAVAGQVAVRCPETGRRPAVLLGSSPAERLVVVGRDKPDTQGFGVGRVAVEGNRAVPGADKAADSLVAAVVHKLAVVADAVVVRVVAHLAAVADAHQTTYLLCPVAARAVDLAGRRVDVVAAVDSTVAAVQVDRTPVAVVVAPRRGAVEKAPVVQVLPIAVAVFAQRPSGLHRRYLIPWFYRSSGIAQSSSSSPGQAPAKCMPIAGATEKSRQSGLILSTMK